MGLVLVRNARVFNDPSHHTEATSTEDSCDVEPSAQDAFQTNAVAFSTLACRGQSLSVQIHC